MQWQARTDTSFCVHFAFPGSWYFRTGAGPPCAFYSSLSIPSVGLTYIFVPTHPHSFIDVRKLKQAIDVLEDMLDNGIQEGKQNMFAAKEYVQIYT